LVSTTDTYGRNLDFLDRTRYFFFQVASQLYSRGWVDPVPGPTLLRECGSAGIELGPLDLQPRTLTTRPQRLSYLFMSECIINWAQKHPYVTLTYVTFSR
jgi:hypothetical protein